MSDLSTLIERVRGLKGGDRETDFAIWVALENGSVVPASPRYLYGDYYTSSIDAVLSLIEKKLPVKKPSLPGHRGPSWAPLLIEALEYLANERARDRLPPHSIDALARALLLALLTALEASHD